jgi:hypothetical protein
MNSIVGLYRLPQKSGIEVPFNISSLIQKIYISPKAENWFVDFTKFIVDFLGYPELIGKIEKIKII